jgi:hypothetical protein
MEEREKTAAPGILRQLLPGRRYDEVRGDSGQSFCLLTFE